MPSLISIYRCCFVMQVPGSAAAQQPPQEASQPANGISMPRNGASAAEADAATPAASAGTTGSQAASASPAAVPNGGAAHVGDTWQWWHHVRALCGHSTKLGVLLVVPITLHSASDIDRWLGEPVKAVLLPTAAFLTNRKGFPVLSRPHRDLLARVFQHGIQVCIPGCEPALPTSQDLRFRQGAARSLCCEA